MFYNVLFIILYFVALTLVVLSVHKKESTDDYLIASRKLGVWATVSTLFTIILASIMSTIDSYVFINSLTLVKNILLKTKNQIRIIKKTKIVILVYLLLPMVLVLFAGSFLNLVFGATTILTIIAPSALDSF